MIEKGDETVLIMQDGEIHRKLPGNDISVIRFLSYAFDLSVFTASNGTPRLFPKDRTLPYLFNPSPNDPVFKRNPQSFRAELHRRFTEWSYSIVFALIALAVIGNARSHRESRINPLVTAVTIALIVRWAGYFAANQVQVAPRLWPIVYLIPLGFAAISIWFIVTNRAMELPVALADRLISGLRQLGDRMMFMRFWRRGTASGRGRLMGWTLEPLLLLPLRHDHDVVFPRRLCADHADRLHRVLQPHRRAARLLRSSSALAVSALRVPMIMLQAVPFVGADRGDGDARLAQPQL